jgi:ribosomal-protein-alanine N-acetyltransferase
MLILETERLLLRHLEMGDLDDLYALYRDPEIRRYFPDGVRDYAETEEELEWFLNGHPSYPELGLWATIHKPDQRFIGRCGLLPWTIDGQDEVEIAYLIDKTYWRRGLATEAATAIRDHAFTRLNVPRLVCIIDPGNRASIGVATKIGMTFDKATDDEFGPFHLYALTNPQTGSRC